MDYSKMGGARGSKGAPRHDEHNRKGTAKNPYGARPSKAELLARMKATAQGTAQAKSQATKKDA